MLVIKIQTHLVVVMVVVVVVQIHSYFEVC